MEGQYPKKQWLIVPDFGKKEKIIRFLNVYLEVFIVCSQSETCNLIGLLRKDMDYKTTDIHFLFEISELYYLPE